MTCLIWVCKRLLLMIPAAVVIRLYLCYAYFHVAGFWIAAVKFWLGHHQRGRKVPVKRKKIRNFQLTSRNVARQDQCNINLLDTCTHLLLDGNDTVPISVWRGADTFYRVPSDLVFRCKFVRILYRFWDIYKWQAFVTANNNEHCFVLNSMSCFVLLMQCEHCMDIALHGCSQELISAAWLKGVQNALELGSLFGITPI